MTTDSRALPPTDPTPKRHDTEEAAIPPLPAHLLPPPECKGKGGGKSGKKKKKMTKKEQDALLPRPTTTDEAAVSGGQEGREQGERRKEGLERTVEELLRDYVPASVEGKRPFYCRICRFQGGRCVDGWLGCMCVCVRRLWGWGSDKWVGWIESSQERIHCPSPTFNRPSSSKPPTQRTRHPNNNNYQQRKGKALPTFHTKPQPNPPPFTPPTTISTTVWRSWRRTRAQSCTHWRRPRSGASASAACAASNSRVPSS
jgi:hypothetical protein